MATLKTVTGQPLDCPAELRLLQMQKAAENYRKPPRRAKATPKGEQSTIFDHIVADEPPEAELAAKLVAPPKPTRRRRARQPRQRAMSVVR